MAFALYNLEAAMFLEGAGECRQYKRAQRPGAVELEANKRLITQANLKLFINTGGHETCTYFLESFETYFSILLISTSPVIKKKYVVIYSTLTHGPMEGFYLSTKLLKWYAKFCGI